MAGQQGTRAVGWVVAVHETTPRTARRALVVARAARRSRCGVTSTRRSVMMVQAVEHGATTPVDEKKEKELKRVVCKFGGSSLANAERLREVTKLIKLQMEKSEQYPVVVLSAMGPSTNELLAAGEKALLEGIVDISTVRTRAYEACDSLGLNKEDLVDPLLSNLDQLLLGIKFIKELSPRTKDQLVSYGERMSVRIMAAHLRINEALPAVHFDAYDLGFRTDSNYTNAELLSCTHGLIQDAFQRLVGENTLAIVTGFIAKDEKNCVTTLGRGGSDLTATTIGAALGVTEVQVWKDVDGILSTDPRLVKDVVQVPLVTFDEASEMAYFGAKVLHPVAMQPARKYSIPVRVKNSYNPNHPGTRIVNTRDVNKDKPVTSLSLKRGVTVVDIVSTRMLGAYGFLAEVFKVFAQLQISVDMIASSEVSISLTLDKACGSDGTCGTLEQELSEVANVQFERNKAIISIVTNVPRSSWVLANAMGALEEGAIDVEMISQGASKYNISFITKEKDCEKALRLLHQKFFEE
ncbi:Aspartokinase 3, chloroplastic [Porphyridium purpureum]|uniref:Aspartokinase n=1 Tax=Porphyridium purpureum TaxID=35688 RepID=A0A5J4YQ93_PORPP|nr:Aspartokinase 3, chloroplastic [Porphyridium purpureum]|eukprot:POR2731..scf236_6